MSDVIELPLEVVAPDTPAFAWPEGVAPCEAVVWIRDGVVREVQGPRCSDLLDRGLATVRGVRWPGADDAVVAAFFAPPASGTMARPVFRAVPVAPHPWPRRFRPIDVPAGARCVADLVFHHGERPELAVAAECPAALARAIVDAAGRTEWGIRGEFDPGVLFHVAAPFVWTTDPLDLARPVLLPEIGPWIRELDPPSYPPEAKEEGRGDARCACTLRVGTDGRPRVVSIDGCPHVFHAATSAALEAARFWPGFAGGAPVETDLVMFVTYALR